MSKSKGYLAVEELVKAQDTHMKLKRQFQEEKLQENIMKMREVCDVGMATTFKTLGTERQEWAKAT